MCAGPGSPLAALASVSDIWKAARCLALAGMLLKSETSLTNFFTLMLGHFVSAHQESEKTPSPVSAPGGSPGPVSTPERRAQAAQPGGLRPQACTWGGQEHQAAQDPRALSCDIRHDVRFAKS